MSRTRSLDKNWDWVFCGKQAYITRTDEVVQNIQTRLKQWKYNCFFALNDGIDWAYYGGSKDTEQDIADEVQAMVIKTDGVYKINDISVSKNDRTLNININIDTIYTKNININVEI